ncbi:MAG TPA: hypothetical protein QF604_20345 [Candidatus Latescibacteria bacterium]|nr:hypothetical protein [Candidatus Latescibacterota bacterium]MDP7633960.1 hypothetical protein [Candidatus Latescibacterota bacterium]HJN30261.1 hypothetical protein [Candidatus Latescibacterota bacterium]
MWKQARAADPDGNPLSPLDTLILHELTEMAAIRTGLPPEAAHVVASDGADVRSRGRTG